MAKKKPERGVEAIVPTSDIQADWFIRQIENSRDLYCLCRHGKIEYINEQGLRILGLKSLKRLVGRPFADFFSEIYRDIARSALTGEAAEEIPMPMILQRGKGPEYRVDVDFSFWGDPENGYVAVHAHDITVRHKAMENLLRNEERFRRLVDSALDLICVCEKGVITFINAAGIEMLHEENAKSLVGRKITSLIHPEYRSIFKDGFDEFAEELNRISESGSSFPLKFKRRTGESIDVEVAIMPFGDGVDRAFMLEAKDITQRLLATGQLREREQRLHGIMNAVADAIVTIDDTGKVMSFNPAAERIFGYDAHEVISNNVKMLMPGEVSKKHDDYLKRYKKRGKSDIVNGASREMEGRRKDGVRFPIEIAISELRQGKETYYTGIIRDITERKNTEMELRRAHEELENRVEERTKELTQEISERIKAEEKLILAAEVIDNLNEAVIIVNERFKVTSVNPAYSEISGYGANDVVGKVPQFHRTLKKNREMYDRMWLDIDSKGRWEGEFWDKKRDGQDYAVRMSISVIFVGEKETLQYAVVINDITKRKQDEERIFLQANFDALTGLPNRTMFHDRLDQGMTSGMRTSRKLGLMFIDLDGFKLVNDSLGHDIGDLLLKEAAARLLNCIRKGDTVARLGGDEFTVIMPNLVHRRHASLLAQRILDALSKPFILRGHESFVSASIGVTIFPDDAKEPINLIKNADAAMYRAKDHGKATYHFYTSDLNEEVQERLILKNGLSKALEEGELSLHYQPKLEIPTGRITGVEALMRWSNKDLGNISPARFIPILEETGMVVEVGEWAIKTACEQHKAWMEAGLPPIRIAVNLSARQLREASFVSIVKKVMKKARVEPESLEIEITESMLMSDASNAVVALEELHDYGLHVAMDDFGTGYSSLSYLKNFPIDTIKIDRSFVADIATNPDDSEIIKTIINIGKTLNRKVVAEGVETEEQLSILRNFECDEIQGYFFSPPMPAEKITDFLKEHQFTDGD